MATGTVIGPTIVIDGQIESGEDIAIQGTIKGKIKTTADLFVEESGTVQAEVETRSIEIRGTVVGDVRASDKYEIQPEGRVTGDVFAPRVVISDGSRFKGHVDMAEGGGRPRPEPESKGGPKAKK